jgi:hypothetical protein
VPDDGSCDAHLSALPVQHGQSPLFDFAGDKGSLHRFILFTSVVGWVVNIADFDYYFGWVTGSPANAFCAGVGSFTVATAPGSSLSFKYSVVPSAGIGAVNSA